MKHRLILFFVLVVQGSCTKEFPWWQRAGVDTSSLFPLTDLVFQYGNMNAGFFGLGLSCENSDPTNAADRNFILQAANDSLIFQVRIFTDSLRPSSYNLDGVNGTVSLFYNQYSQIGTLGTGSFQLDITKNNSFGISGTFQGYLLNLFTVTYNVIDGRFDNIPITPV
jgi:hypothetical protein